MIWHFTPKPGRPTDAALERLREHLYHPDMPEKFEMIEGKLFWDEKQRYHVLGILIETLGTEAVEQFILQYRGKPDEGPAPS